MDTQKMMLQGLWRKAFKKEGGLELNCKTPSNATKMRFALYAAVRGVREGKEKADEELLQAIENCSISFAEEDKSILFMRRSVLTDMMQLVSEVLEDSPELVKTQEQMEMEASQRLVMEKLRNGVSGGHETPTAADLGLPRTTPYYTR